jgi:hypothetical protein
MQLRGEFALECGGCKEKLSGGGFLVEWGEERGERGGN